MDGCRYYYYGAVEEFGKCIATNWYGETWAKSEKKARNNLIHQFKKANNKSNATRITLPGKVLKK